MLTGTPAYLHGRFPDFTGGNARSEFDLVDCSIAEVPESPWSIIEAEGGPCVSVGWLGLPPAIHAGVHDGFFSADFNPAITEMNSGATAIRELRMRPDEVGEELLEALAPKWRRSREMDPRRIALKIAISDLFSRHAVATRLLEASNEWKAAFLHYPFLDLLSEAFLPFEEPSLEGFREADYHAWSGVLDNAVRLLDQCIGRIWGLIGPETRLFLFGAYGLASGVDRPRQASQSASEHALWRNRRGFFVAAGPGLKRDVGLGRRSALGVIPAVLGGLGLKTPGPSCWTDIWSDQTQCNRPIKVDGLNASRQVAIKDADNASAQSLNEELRLRRWWIESAVDAGQLQLALQGLESLLERFPESAIDRLCAIDLCSRLGLVDQASCHAEIHMDANPGLAAADVLAAELRFERDDFDGTREVLDRLTIQEWESPDLQSRAALVYLRLGEVDRARGIFEGILQTDPEHGYANLGMGYFWFVERDLAQALERCERGLRKQSDFYLGWWLKAEILNASEDPQGCLEAVRVALALDPPKPSGLFHLAADCCERLPGMESIGGEYRKTASEFARRALAAYRPPSKPDLEDL